VPPFVFAQGDEVFLFASEKNHRQSERRRRLFRACNTPSTEFTPSQDGARGDDVSSCLRLKRTTVSLSGGEDCSGPNTPSMEFTPSQDGARGDDVSSCLRRNKTTVSLSGGEDCLKPQHPSPSLRVTRSFLSGLHKDLVGLSPASGRFVFLGNDQ